MESTENYPSATTLTSAIPHETTLTPIVETQLPTSIKSDNDHSTLEKFHSASLFETEGLSSADMFVTQTSNQTEAGSVRAEVFSTSFLEDGQEFSSSVQPNTTPLVSDKTYILVDSSASDEFHFISLDTGQSTLGSRFVATASMIGAVSDSNALTLPAISLSLSIDSDVSYSTYEGKSSSALLLESIDSSSVDILVLTSILNEMSTHVSSSFLAETVS